MKNNPKSFGGAMSSGVPVVFTAKNKIPQVILRKGKEKEALETMQKMKLVELLYVEKLPTE